MNTTSVTGPLGRLTVEDVPFAALEAIRIRLGLKDQFWEMPMGEVAARLRKEQPYHNRKWTRGELRRAVRDDETTMLREIVQYLCERGPRVVAWDDESDPEGERIAQEDRESAEYDAQIDREAETLRASGRASK
jgi:hypothetical protein